VERSSSEAVRVLRTDAKRIALCTTRRQRWWRWHGAAPATRLPCSRRRLAAALLRERSEPCLLTDASMLIDVTHG
jgi:hypothetical protein